MQCPTQNIYQHVWVVRGGSEQPIEVRHREQEGKSFSSFHRGVRPLSDKPLRDSRRRPSEVLAERQVEVVQCGVGAFQWLQSRGFVQTRTKGGTCTTELVYWTILWACTRILMVNWENQVRALLQGKPIFSAVYPSRIDPFGYERQMLVT